MQSLRGRVELHFYGKRAEPATIDVARAFGEETVPRRLPTGQGTSFLAGNIVLKPSEGAAVAAWAAELFARLPASPAVRFARPLKSRCGTWEYQGYVAWTRLEGTHQPGQYENKLAASREFHILLQAEPRPGFLITPESSWSAADCVATGEKPFDYDDGFMQLYSQIAPRLKPLNLPCQLVHGDLGGNFLLHPELPPAIIDFSASWAPSGFAEAIMLTDEIVWQYASLANLRCWNSIPTIEQLAWRGVIRRIAEQAEHVKFLDKDRTLALHEARHYMKAIDMLDVLFGDGSRR